MKKECMEFVNVKEIGSLDDFLEKLPSQNALKVTNNLYIVNESVSVIQIPRGKVITMAELLELHSAYVENRLHFFSAYEVTI